jgi:hypothetical protein
LQVPINAIGAVPGAAEQFSMVHLSSVSLLMQLLQNANAAHVLGYRSIRLGSAASSSSCGGGDSRSRPTVLAQELHRAGLFKHIPLLMQALAVHLDSIQDSSTLLLAASSNLFTATVAELEAVKSVNMFALLQLVSRLMILFYSARQLMILPYGTAISQPALQLYLAVLRFVSRCVDQLPAQHLDAPRELQTIWYYCLWRSLCGACCSTNTHTDSQR